MVRGVEIGWDRESFDLRRECDEDGTRKRNIEKWRGGRRFEKRRNGGD